MTLHEGTGAAIAKTTEAATARGRDPDVLTAKEAAVILGVSVWSLYAAAGRQEVPHRRLGRLMLFSRQALLAWLRGAGQRDVGEE